MPERNYNTYKTKKQAIEAELARLEKTREGTETLAQILRRPEVSYGDLPPSRNLPEAVIQQVEITIKYAGYIARQDTEVAKIKTFEEKQIPSTFDYSVVPSLRAEARQKLMKIRPGKLGQASRISGVSPADISILMVWLKRTGLSTVPKD